MKAYAGFYNNEVCGNNKSIITGNWGCGVFNGDVGLKFMIQWLASSITGFKMKYCPFGNGLNKR